MWSDDNQDRLLYSAQNTDGALVWVTGTLDYSANKSNWSPSNIMNSPMWFYCGTNLSIWKCPSDQSYVVVNGVPKSRVRSFSMNTYFGNALSFAPAYRSYKRFSEIDDPPPSRLFVFLDRRDDVIGYPDFFVDMTGYSLRNPAQYNLGDYPGAYHDGGAGFSYADGRGELHRWLDRRTTTPSSFVTASPNNPDVAWLQDRATRRK